MTTTIRTVVRPGGLIQFTAPEWAEGQTVEVTVSAPAAGLSKSTLLAWLDALPPSIRTPEEWEQFERDFQEERNSWDR